jgi:hypothetical protein
MKRPSFQFYPADWRNNAKLRRCSEAARGAWMDVLCVLHDSDEYGVCRWPLADLARAAGVPLKLVRELAAKDVLKGADKGAAPYIYTPRHAGKDGDPATLVEPEEGPCWYCSRFVRDEWVRQRRGQSTRFDEDKQPPKIAPNQPPMAAPELPPKGGIGARQGDGSTSTSTSSLKPKTLTPLSGKPDDMPPGFAEFWQAWPKSSRKDSKTECLKRWRARHLEAESEAIIAGVLAKKATKKWLDGYEPAPLTFLNQRQWLDDAGDLVTPAVGASRTPPVDSRWVGAK